MQSSAKVLHLREDMHDDAPLPDESEVRARFCEADFQVTRMCPWWVGQTPVVSNAITWVTGADAAAVYLVRGCLVAVVARRTGRRVVWATADLGELSIRKAA